MIPSSLLHFHSLSVSYDLSSSIHHHPVYPPFSARCDPALKLLLPSCFNISTGTVVTRVIVICCRNIIATVDCSHSNSSAIGLHSLPLGKAAWLTEVDLVRIPDPCPLQRPPKLCSVPSLLFPPTVPYLPTLVVLSHSPLTPEPSHFCQCQYSRRIKGCDS